MELNVDGSWDTEWMYICSLRSMDISLQFLPGPSDGADRHERTRSCVKHGQDGVFGMECQHATPKLVVVTTIAFEGGGGHCTKQELTQGVVGGAKVMDPSEQLPWGLER